MKTIETQVLIVGAGVTGLTSSIALADQGVESYVISRHSGTAIQPRAHITNQRTMEVFRDLGIENQLQTIGVPLSTVGHAVWATSFTGQELFRFRAYGGGERQWEYESSSPSKGYNVPQHVMEPVLLDAARARGAQVHFMHELLTIEQDEDGVTAIVQERESGEKYRVRAAYAIGADGGRSRVAEQTGIEFEGQSGLMHMVNAWVEADLTPFAEHRPSVIYAMFQPGSDSWVGAGSFICVTPFKEWVFVRQYDPSLGEPDLSDEAIAETVRNLIGDADVEIKVKDTSKWQVNNLFAKEYQRGRVFIAGDAAHRHNPSSGLGTNTCVQDAYNLAWKLAFVIKSKAAPSLLESYAQERQPVGEAMVQWTMERLRDMEKISGVLGLRAGQSAAEGWDALQHLASAEQGASARREDLQALTKLISRRSNAHGMELGQKYSGNAIVSDGTPWPSTSRDPGVHYEPTTHPGAHLPHAWIEYDRKKISTLDLVGKGRFALIVGVAADPWRSAADVCAKEFGIDLPVYAVGYRCEYDDVLLDWDQLRGTDDSGAILVRPDGFVAWRASTAPNDPERTLSAVFKQILGK